MGTFAEFAKSMGQNSARTLGLPALALFGCGGSVLAVPQLDASPGDAASSGVGDSGSPSSGPVDGGPSPDVGPPPLRGDSGESGLDAGFIDPSTACLGAQNILLIEGKDIAYSGPPLEIVGGSGWSASVGWTTTIPPWNIVINIPHDWGAQFTTGSEGLPLAAGTYQVPYNVPGAASFNVGSTLGCSSTYGQFTVLEITTEVTSGAYAVTSFTATFELHCSKEPGDVGCIHFASGQ